MSSEYTTPRSATRSSAGGMSSHTPSSAEQLTVIDRRASSGSGSSHSPSDSSMSVGSTPLQTASTSSRPRNLLEDLKYRTQRSGSATHGEEDSLETYSDGSYSSLDSSDVDY